MIQISRAKFYFLIAAALTFGVLGGAIIVNERYQLWQLSDEYTVRLPPGETPDNICAELATANEKADRIITSSVFRPTLK